MALVIILTGNVEDNSEVANSYAKANDTIRLFFIHMQMSMH